MLPLVELLRFYEQHGAQVSLDDLFGFRPRLRRGLVIVDRPKVDRILSAESPAELEQEVDWEPEVVQCLFYVPEGATLDDAASPEAHELDRKAAARMAADAGHVLEEWGRLHQPRGSSSSEEAT